MAWDPALYEKFRSERGAPFVDALALVTRRPGLSVIDLGCGTGELTQKLADALPDSDVIGIDASDEMLARSALYARPGLRFEKARIEEASGRWDLVFSHAAIQWVDDHERLVPRLFGLVAAGGQLVVQLPSNHDHPSQRLLAALAAEEPFRGVFAGFHRQSSVLPVDRYAELLHAAGGTEVTVLEKVYPHVLPDADAMAEFSRATACLPYLERLPPGLHES